MKHDRHDRPTDGDGGDGSEDTLPTTDVSLPGHAHVDGGDAEPSGIVAGAHLGRYQLTERVGEGGMGVVWAARDPELDRVVAVKVLRLRAANADGELRLRREGQTMARLTHGNVIRVYDVGVAHGALFVAMEYVAGGTLHDWLERAPRSQAEIVDVFVQAGRGLAAAHAAGLVHRDFKPSNVLVGADRRVLVTDFGLARSPSLDSPVPGSLRISGTFDDSGGLLHTITRAGGVVGTPAFMAPEQHAGGPVDPRADQFAFCVALWRALYKQPPFEGRTIEDLATATRAGVLVAPPAGARVPAHLRAALERGLRAAPAERWPSMEPLLDALTDDPGRRRRLRLIAAAVVVAAIGGAVAIWTLAPRDGEPCRSPRDRFAGVWDAERAQAVHAAFVATRMPYAEASFREVARQLDARRDAWEAMRLDSCLATRVRGEQSDAMMDARAHCLDQRLADVGAFVAVLGNADAAMVGGAPQAAAGVGDVTACGDGGALARRQPPPDDPAKRARIAALEHDLAGARALDRTERFRDLATRTDPLVARAREIGYPPLLGDALALAADVASQLDRAADAEKLYEEADLAAEAGGDDALRFDCETALVRVVGYELERDADGERHAERAAALMARLGPDPRRTGLLARTRALAHWWNGRYAEARAQAEAAVAAFERIDPAGVELARALHIRAIVEQELKDPQASVATEARARALAEHALGPQHPLVAQIWNTSGGSLRMLGRYDEAIDQLGRALAIHEATKGADSTDVGVAVANIALVYLDEDQPAKAIPLLERSIAIFRARYGPEHSRVADELENLGGAYSKAGRDADAEATLAQAVAIHRARLGPDAPATASSWKRLGYHRLHVRRWAAARDAFTEAVRALDASQGPKSPVVINPLVGLGEACAGLADWKAAAAAYQRALDLTPPTETKDRAEIGARLAAVRAHL